MGWIFSIAFFFSGAILKNTTLYLVSGLFAISGSIFASAALWYSQREKEKKEQMKLWQNLLTALTKPKNPS